MTSWKRLWRHSIVCCIHVFYLTGERMNIGYKRYLQ